ncbi:MAG: hypothetical protein IT521_13470 [Burkholderiales bacterium]|nr:hypothetical protein [Burkholderiales bacterium]
MMGLAYILAFFVYVVVVILLARVAARAARRHGRVGWKWGALVALVGYLLVFWDHVPTLLVHKYQCAQRAHLIIAETPEQWKLRHPDSNIERFILKTSFNGVQFCCG